jgi:hypothetical protein
MEPPENDDAPAPSHPYRTPTEVATETHAARATKAKVLTALAALSAAHGAEEESETLSRRAADARVRETIAAVESMRTVRRAARAAFEDERWNVAEGLYRQCVAWGDGGAGPLLDDAIALATTLRHLRRWSESEPLFARATRSREPLHDEAPIVAAHDFGVLLVHLGRSTHAEPILVRTLERAESSHGTNPSDRSALEVARLHHALGECLLDLEEIVIARGHVDRVLAIRAEILGESHPLYGATLGTRARMLHATGDLSGAENEFARALERTTSEQATTIGSAQTLVALASLLADAKRIDEADRLLRASLRAVEVAGTEHAFVCRALRVRATIDRRAGRERDAAAAEARLARIVALWSE